jgi:hypothetical protein
MTGISWMSYCKEYLAASGMRMHGVLVLWNCQGGDLLSQMALEMLKDDPFSSLHTGPSCLEWGYGGSSCFCRSPALSIFFEKIYF